MMNDLFGKQLNFTDEEKKLLNVYYHSGNICNRFNNCSELHELAAALVNGRNQELYSIISENPEININEEEWVHVDALVLQWRKELESTIINENKENEERFIRKQKRAARDKFSSGKW